MSARKKIMRSDKELNNDDGISIDNVKELDSAMKKLIKSGKKQPVSVTIEHFQKIITSLISFKKLNKNLFTQLQKYLEHQDILDFCWKIFPEVTPKIISMNNTIFIENVLELVTAALNKSLTADFNQESCAIFAVAADSDIWEYDYSKIRRNVNKTWMNILNWNVKNDNLRRQILILLLEKFMAHIAKPLLLTDFFMESLDMGGPISLLGLQGIFILIQYHNLTCPDIYEKLYNLFEPEIFHTKFKSRLFYLADIFLTSTHLPENLVAAFAKRLSRLSLYAPPQDILIIINFVGNLIIRHPGLKMLMSNPSEETVTTDPYIMEEVNPNEANAMASSLWEIAAMKQHVIPNVSSAAKSLFNSLPSQEFDLGSLLDVDVDSLFEVPARKQYKEFPMNHEPVIGMFKEKDDKIKEFWKLF